jgi:hypothetical protein
MLWIHVATATRGDIGKAGIAHALQLTEGEYTEIERERDRIFGHVIDVSRSPGSTADPIPATNLVADLAE